MNRLGLLDIKSALWDERFRKEFPEYEKEIKEWLKNPGCPCNANLYKNILSHKDRLSKYFPTKEILTPAEEADILSNNKWKVINCHVNEAEKELRKMPKGRKQLAVARWQDQVTIVINELDILI